MLKFWLRFCLFACVILNPCLALAEGFGLYEWSARGVALGGAMVARDPDASALAFNPALITRLQGINVMAGITSVSPKGKMKWSGGSTKMEDHTWYIPHLYYTQQLNDDWYIGVGEFTRYGLGFKYPSAWPGSQSVYEISLSTFSINPNIAWKATNKLSLNAGVEMVYGCLDLKKRASGGAVDVKLSDMEDVAPGFNLGLHYQFNEQWAAGILYRSAVRAKLEGDGTLRMAASGTVISKGDVTSRVKLPDSVAAGLSWTPLPELSFEAGATWTRWSTFDSLDFRGTPHSDNKKDWHDVWRLNFGVEWKALDWLALRAGYVFDESPMNSKYEDYLVPTDDRHIFSVGLGFMVQDWTVDFSYAYIYAVGRKYANTMPSYPYTVESKADVGATNVLSLSVGYKF